MVKGTVLTRRQLGNIGEAKAKLFFIERGYDIFIPETVNPPIDFIVLKDGICSKVEVKCSNVGTGEIKLSTSYTTMTDYITNSFKADADLLVLYHYLTDTLKVVRAADYHDRNTVRITAATCMFN